MNPGRFGRVQIPPKSHSTGGMSENKHSWGVNVAVVGVPAIRRTRAPVSNSDIGDQINKKIIAPLANANKLSDMPDFNDDTKLGSGKEKEQRPHNSRFTGLMDLFMLGWRYHREVLNRLPVRHELWEY